MMLSVLVIPLVVLACASSTADAAFTAVCRTNYQGSPDNPAPLVYGITVSDGFSISWMTANTPPYVKGVTQVGYEVEMFEVGLPQRVWAANASSNKQSLFISAGMDQDFVLNIDELKPDTAYTYTVNVHLSTGDTAKCNAAFETAPSATFLGYAEWITGGGQYVATNGLEIPAGEIARARVFITGMGSFYLFVNGKKVGENIMDPPQTVYSRTILYTTFDVTSVLVDSAVNHFGALLGTYKWGYTDQWINMTATGGPNGARVLKMSVIVTMKDGKSMSLHTSSSSWKTRTGPVVWDHFFHGETYDATMDPEWIGIANTSQRSVDQAWMPAVTATNLPATAPQNMEVMNAKNQAVALGQIKPTMSPPLRVTGTFPALSMSHVHANDVGSAYIFDFGQNMAGMVTLKLPAGHSIHAGTQIRIEHGEIIQGVNTDTSDMCKICPKCGGCVDMDCDSRSSGAVCDTYCNNPALNGGENNHTLRHEPCFPHQSYTPGFPVGGIKAHETPNRYIGDFNNANMTNIYVVSGNIAGESYTPYFSAAGFRYVQVSGLPSSFIPSLELVTALRIHSDVASASSLTMPSMEGLSLKTENVLNKIHSMTRASQSSNLWSIPTDCPQRERRGWMGDAQASCDEAMQNFDMMSFYSEFLDKIRDDQLRFAANDGLNAGALADVVPYDGIGGEIGCPIWQVAYIVIANRMLKHYGDDAIPVLTKHLPGLTALLDWFNRNADPTSGLLLTFCYGDWMGFNPESGNRGSSSLTDQSLATAFYHVLATKYMNDITSALKNSTAAKTYMDDYDKLKTAFHDKFFDPVAVGYGPCKQDMGPGKVNSGKPCHGTSSHGSQTSNSIALALGAPPNTVTAYKVAENLAADVMAFGNRTTTGVVGIAWLLPILDQYGFDDIAVSLLLNDAYPSIGHMAHQNMTTLCENYACTYHDAGGGSQNHIMLGGFDAWVASSIGGVDASLNTIAGAGWRNIEARVPGAVISMLKESSYSKLTRFGTVQYSWKLIDNKLTTNVVVPIGSSLNMYTPKTLKTSYGTLTLSSMSEVSSNSTQMDFKETETHSPKSTGKENGYFVSKVESGQYVFEANYV